MRKIQSLIKRTIAVALCTVTFLASANLPQVVYAEEPNVKYGGEWYEIRTSGDWQYIVVDKEAVIVRCKSDASSISVPSKLDECPVKEIGYHTDRWGDVDGGAFEGNSSMQSVTVPASVKTIGTRAFKGCVGLQQVLVAEGIEKVGSAAFENCEYMQKISFRGNTLKTISSWAFNNCKALDGVSIPTSVETIADHAFSNCAALSEIVIPDSVTKLGGAAFMNCKVLNNAVIGNGVERIESIDRWQDRSGNYNNDWSGAFENCTNLLSVTIGTGVTGIDMDAFANTGLLSVVIPGNVVSIGAGAFMNCGKMKSAVISEGVKTLADCAFMSCSSLETMDLGTTVKSIGTRAFSYDSSLKEIDIPMSVLSLGAGCFYGCSSMTKAVIGNGVESLYSVDYWQDRSGNYDNDRSGMFENCKALEEVIIGDGVKEIGTDAFAGTALKTLVIPDGVTSLGKGFAMNCKSLESVIIGDGVSSIGHYALTSCDNLKEVQIGSGVTIIGDKAFAHNPSLKELLIPSSVTSLGAGVCYKDTALEKCIVGNGVTEIRAMDKWTDRSGNYNNDWSGAFENCTNLTEVTLGSGITAIKVDAFAGTALTSVVIPAKAATIGDGAFCNTKVAKAYFTGHAPSSLGKQIFQNTPGTITYNIAGKLGYGDIASYSFVEFTPIKVKYDIGEEVFANSPNDQIMAPEGGYVIEPISPVAEGYLFLGWYHDKEFTTPWNFLNDKVTEDTTIYAKWVKTNETAPEAPKEVVDMEKTPTTVSVSWKEVAGATSYKVYVNSQLVVENIVETNYKLTGLQPDSAYEVVIAAVNEKGESDGSLVKVVYTAEGSAEEDNQGNTGDDDQGNTGDDDQGNTGDDDQGSTGDDDQGDTPDIVMGDADGNGKVELNDASVALKMALGIIPAPEGEGLKIVDTDRSGKLELNDVVMILKAALGIIFL